MVALVLWRMWMMGEISGVAPHSRRGRARLLWLVVGAVNFVAFVVHVLIDHGSAFPTGGRLVGEQYLVLQHGKDIPFTVSGHLFNYWHGVFFIVVQLVCMFALWRLRKWDTDRKQPANDH